jgi:hypothetical protein
MELVGAFTKPASALERRPSAGRGLIIWAWRRSAPSPVPLTGSDRCLQAFGRRHRTAARLSSAPTAGERCGEGLSSAIFLLTG